MKNAHIHFFYSLLAVLPNYIKIPIYNNFLDCQIHPSSKIGISYVRAKKIIMGPNSSIGHFNIINNLTILKIGENSKIGNKNRASAIPIGSKKHFSSETNRIQSLIIGNQSGIVKGHFFDCNNTISIGDFAIIAGHGSSFYTHSINIKENRQETGKINIGNYTMVGACSIITRGAELPDCSILAANSTLHEKFVEKYMLYSGVPASPIKALGHDFKFFNREKGYID